MASSKHQSIRSRLSIGFLKTTGISLSIVMILFFSIEFARSRDAMTRNLSVLSSVIGMNAASALIFDDTSAAEETLSAFTAEVHVMAAVIYDADGEVFARYSRFGLSDFDAPMARRDGIEFDWFGPHAVKTEFLKLGLCPRDDTLVAGGTHSPWPDFGGYGFDDTDG